jgi:proton-translocating NADH-quinone oxidoreductase chain M
MLLSILFVYSYAHTTDINVLYKTQFPFNRQLILWLCFFFAFAVKVPMFPFHIWLPEAHVEAPTIGSVILAGVLLKMGSYGMFRFIIPLFSEATYFFVPLVFTLCLLGIVYTCLTTIRQIDLKKIIAYSSVSHMSFVLLGLFSTNALGVIGSLFLMLSHGIISSGLFFCIGCLYDRYKTRILRYYSGLVNVMPLFAVILFILTLGNISFPGTSGFIGEFMILIGLYGDNSFAAFISTLSIILTAIYSIWLYNRLVFGSLQVKYFNIFQDLSKREFYIGCIFCALAVLFGLKPTILLSLLDYPIYTFIQYK